MMAARLNGDTTNLPHTRGDEPMASVAAMLRNRNLPHTRGDEPGLIFYMGENIMNLPHTRGDEPCYIARTIFP